MTRAEQGFRERLNRSFAPFRNLPGEHVEAACARVLHDLREEGDSGPEPVETPSIPVHAGGTWIRAAATLSAAAAVVVAAVLWMPIRDLAPESGVSARVEMVDGGLYRGSRDEGLRPGDRIDAGDLLRTNGGAGAMVVLSDGSRVEMRSESELALERADDGIRIRLNRGGIIVNAVTRRTGHLYVQTQDMTVSVVGTVFLVNVGEEGSRVAVIEGEVNVRQGATETTLMSGEQVATNPGLQPPTFVEQIGWSRNAEAHLAWLQQSAVAPPPLAAPSSTEVKDAFEVVTIRRSEPASSTGARGAGAGGGVTQWGCGISSPTIDPRRFAVAETTVYTLIVWAYGSKGLHSPGCGQESQLNLISGGPAWIRVDLFDIQAVIPEGTPFETREQRGNGDAPGLRRMLQSLLAERFKLAVHRESREAPVYALTVARDAAKFADPNGATVWLTGNTEQTGDMLLGGALRDPGVIGDTGVRNGEVMQVFRGRNASVANLATSLGPAMGRPVLDRTGLTGRFNFDFWVAPLEFGVLTTLFRSTPRASTPSIFAVLDEVGLTLAPTRAPLEMLVIDRVEGPTEN